MNNWTTWLLISLITIIMMVVVVRWIVKKDKAEEEKDDVVTDDQELDEDTGKVHFSARNVALTLRELLYDKWTDVFSDPIDRDSTKAFEIILDLTDDQLVRVANAYNNEYKDDAKPTLSGLVHSEIVISGVLKKKVIQYLNDLNIY